MSNNFEMLNCYPVYLENFRSMRAAPVMMQDTVMSNEVQKTYCNFIDDILSDGRCVEDYIGGSSYIPINSAIPSIYNPKGATLQRIKTEKLAADARLSTKLAADTKLEAEAKLAKTADKLNTNEYAPVTYSSGNDFNNYNLITPPIQTEWIAGINNTYVLLSGVILFVLLIILLKK